MAQNDGSNDKKIELIKTNFIVREKLMCEIESMAEMDREQFGSVSLNSSGDGVYRVIIFNIGKTKKGMARERKTVNMSYEDAKIVFDEVLVEIKKNRAKKNEVSKLSSILGESK